MSFIVVRPEADPETIKVVALTPDGRKKSYDLVTKAVFEEVPDALSFARDYAAQNGFRVDANVERCQEPARKVVERQPQSYYC